MIIFASFRRLTARDQWVCWRREERDGKTTKGPVEPATGGDASTTETATWATFETAIEAVASADADGVGFVFTDEDPIVGINLDDWWDPESGALDEWARAIVTRLATYTEVSPSVTGVNIIAEGELPPGRSRKGEVEMSETSRFFTVTGEHLDATQRAVERHVDALRGVHTDYVQDSFDDEGVEYREPPVEPSDGSVDLGDEELLERARSAENDDRFHALWSGETSGYDSHSEADMALCLHLALLTGGDPVRMDALFRQCGLMREKWDEVHYADGATYGERTVERALERVDEIYDPEGASHAGGEQAEAADDRQADGEGELGPASRATSGASVYPDERNRLLRQKDRAQQSTIERQAARIDQLKQELDGVRLEMAAREQIKEGDTNDSSRWNRLATWLGVS